MTVTDLALQRNADGTFKAGSKLAHDLGVQGGHASHEHQTQKAEADDGVCLTSSTRMAMTDRARSATQTVRSRLAASSPMISVPRAAMPLTRSRGSVLDRSLV